MALLIKLLCIGNFVWKIPNSERKFVDVDCVFDFERILRSLIKLNKTSTRALWCRRSFLIPKIIAVECRRVQCRKKLKKNFLGNKINDKRILFCFSEILAVVAGLIRRQIICVELACVNRIAANNRARLNCFLADLFARY